LLKRAFTSKYDSMNDSCNTFQKTYSMQKQALKKNHTFYQQSETNNHQFGS